MTTVTNIQWLWGSNQSIEFNPETDKLNFGWLSANDFTLTERSGSVVISIPSNQQSYTLNGVSFSELSAAKVIANDQSALTTWSASLNNAPASNPVSAPLPPPVLQPTAGAVTTNIGWS